jgi:hypothetical protein
MPSLLLLAGSTGAMEASAKTGRKPDVPHLAVPLEQNSNSKKSRTYKRFVFNRKEDGGEGGVFQAA